MMIMALSTTTQKESITIITIKNTSREKKNQCKNRGFGVEDIIIAIIIENLTKIHSDSSIIESFHLMKKVTMSIMKNLIVLLRI